MVVLGLLLFLLCGVLEGVFVDGLLAVGEVDVVVVVPAALGLLHPLIAGLQHVDGLLGLSLLGEGGLGLVAVELLL